MSPLFSLFLITSIANIATPGLGAVMAVNLGLAGGWRRAIPGCLGLAVGTLCAGPLGYGIGAGRQSLPL